MNNKIILSADATCDLPKELIEKYDVHIFPLHITFEGKSFLDNVDITAEEIFKGYWENKTLPKTAAINISEYSVAFEKWISQGYDIVHINLSSAISASHQNCKIAASAFENVYVIDSKNLSSAAGLLVMEAGKLIAKGLSAKEVYEKTLARTGDAHASFILDTLEFMRAGGRCSSIVALGANLLNLKPCIEVDNTTGQMSVGKKYRGDLSKVLIKYVEDQLSMYDTIDTDTIFITHTVIDSETVEMVKETVNKTMRFNNIYQSVASCTISSHCGPRTLGILFLTK